VRKRPYRKYLKLVAQDGRTLDEMATFDGDMELDAALEEYLFARRLVLTEARARLLVEAWLRDISKEPRQ
jgi:hypothetical protein